MITKRNNRVKINVRDLTKWKTTYSVQFFITWFKCRRNDITSWKTGGDIYALQWCLKLYVYIKYIYMKLCT